MKKSRFKVTFIVALAVAAIMLLTIASACSSPITSTPKPPASQPTATAPTAPTSAPSSTAAPSATAKPAAGDIITLRFSTQQVDMKGAAQDSLRKYAAQIEEKTQGRVKMRIFWGGVIGKTQDTLKFVGQSNVADMAFVVTTYHQWEIPLTAAAGLPFLTTGYKVGYKATQALYNDWTAMQDEWKKVNMMPLAFSQPHEHWMGITINAKTMDDLKGKKMWVGGFWPDLAKAFGIGFVPLSTPEAYEGLQKGLIMGIINPYMTFRDSKFAEFTKYMYKWPFGGQPVNAYAINNDVWKKISAADQKAITDLSAILPSDIAAAQDVEVDQITQYLKDQKCTITAFSDDEYARIATIGKPAILNPWLATAKEKGVPGQEFIDKYTAKVKELSK
jgi:TRAP-type transport system periplasmic protein